MPFKCPYGGEWRYTKEELEAGAPGGIAPAPDEIPPKKKKRSKSEIEDGAVMPDEQAEPLPR